MNWKFDEVQRCQWSWIFFVKQMIVFSSLLARQRTKSSPKRTSLAVGFAGRLLPDVMFDSAMWPNFRWSSKIRSNEKDIFALRVSIPPSKMPFWSDDSNDCDWRANVSAMSIHRCRISSLTWGNELINFLWADVYNPLKFPPTLNSVRPHIAPLADWRKRQRMTSSYPASAGRTEALDRILLFSFALYSANADRWIETTDSDTSLLLYSLRQPNSWHLHDHPDEMCSLPLSPLHTWRPFNARRYCDGR